MRVPKPFYRCFNDTWYLQIGKRQIPLARGEANEKAAYARYYEVMAEEPTGKLPVPLPKALLEEICDLFLTWAEKHTSKTTFAWYRGGDPY
jgi:hypothetical protein